MDGLLYCLFSQQLLQHNSLVQHPQWTAGTTMYLHTKIAHWQGWLVAKGIRIGWKPAGLGQIRKHSHVLFHVPVYCIPKDTLKPADGPLTPTNT